MASSIFSRISAWMDPMSLSDMFARTVMIRSWFLRSIRSGPVFGSTETIFRIATAMPWLLTMVVSKISRTESRSASFTFTRMGYSLPPSRKLPARVPPMMVCRAPVTSRTEIPRLSALSRSTVTTSSGAPVLRLVMVSVIPSTVSMTALTRSASASAVSMSYPRISTSIRSVPPPMVRRIKNRPCPSRVRMIAPGMRESLTRRSSAISALDRSRSDRLTRAIRSCPSLVPPPRQWVPPIAVTVFVRSGTASKTIRSTSAMVRSVISSRVPTAISRFTRTSLSSVRGISSVPMVGIIIRLPANIKTVIPIVAAR